MDNVEVKQKPIRCLEDAIERCQTLGMRVSRQRRYILELLWQAREHLPKPRSPIRSGHYRICGTLGRQTLR
jgi:hypothetical protein